MSKVNNQEGFTCNHCHKHVSSYAPGTKHRNHCPWCLWSQHVAVSHIQDDRQSQCQGLMEPIAISTQKDGEWSLVHRCVKCGLIRTNRIAGDDDETLLLCLALQPLTKLPFPLDVLLMHKKNLQ
jgi:hypothetical protein